MPPSPVPSAPLPNLCALWALATARAWLDEKASDRKQAFQFSGFLTSLNISHAVCDAVVLTAFLPLTPGGSVEPERNEVSGIQSSARVAPVFSLEGRLWNPKGGWGLANVFSGEVAASVDFLGRGQPFELWVKDLRPETVSSPAPPPEWFAVDRATALSALGWPSPPPVVAPEAWQGKGFLEAVFREVLSENLSAQFGSPIQQAAQAVAYLAHAAGLDAQCHIQVVSSQGHGPVQERYALELFRSSPGGPVSVVRWEGLLGLRAWTSAPRPVALPSWVSGTDLPPVLAQRAHGFLEKDPRHGSYLRGLALEHNLAGTSPAPRSRM